MGLALDQISTGDWLLCTRGNKYRTVTQFGESVEEIQHAYEGVLMHVLAISAPMIFVKVYPVPCEDISHPFHPSFNLTWKWGDLEFTRPSRGYLRAYLKRVREAEEKHSPVQKLKKAIEHSRRQQPSAWRGPFNDDDDDTDGSTAPPLPPVRVT